jgi:tRNA1Val (adenine37-N6)-methyltransferase
LPLQVLFKYAARMLSGDGELSLIIPADRLNDVLSEAVFSGLYESRICRVRTVEHKTPKRVLVAFAKTRAEKVEQTEETMMTANGKRSLWLTALTRDFYLDVK